MADVDPYEELARQTQNLVCFRRYRDDARHRKAEAIRKETENIDAETTRIEETKLRIGELVEELGMNR